MTTARIRRPPGQRDATEMEKPKLFIATPCYGCQAMTPYIAALRQLTRSLDASGIPHTVELMGNESLITRARNKCVAQFLKTDCTHLVFIDADVGFDSRDLAAMIRSGFDVTVGAYPMKAIGWGNVSQAVKDGKKADALAKLGGLYAVNPYVADMETGRIDVAEREGAKYVRVEDGATGFMVLRREALERFIKHYGKDIEYVTDYEPVGETHWMVFQADRDPIAVAAGKPARYLSEDYHFCRKWQQMGGEVWLNIDAQLSHTGTYRFEGDIGLLFDMEDEVSGKDGQPALAVPVSSPCVVPLAGGGPESPAHLIARKADPESYESGRPPPMTYDSLPVTFVDP